MIAPGVAGAIVRVDDRETDATVADKLVDLVVDRQLRLPDRATLRYRDFDLAVVDGGTFSIGSSLQIQLGSAETSGVATVFDGQITGLEPEFTSQGATLVVCGLDRAHLLQRSSRTATYQQTSYGEIATQLAEQAGLEASPEISSGLTLPFVQQSNETDWDFLWRLALEVDYQVRVEGRELGFSPAGKLGSEVTGLTWGAGLLAFRPRVTGVQQVDEVTVRGWDPATATAIEASASAPAPENRLGIDRDKVIEAIGNARATVVDRPVTSQAHAETVANSLAAQLASVFVEGDGTAKGTPQLAAGGQVRIAGVGESFSGTYAVTGVRHHLRSPDGYLTDFSICGRAHRTVLGLSRAPESLGWHRRIVVGVVTNASDPEKLGRVRVKYPALDDSHEGWWARVLAPGSGAARGLFSLPQVGDEVLIAFEHENDQHPYLLGSVFNGTKTPGTVVQDDGSFTLATPRNVTIDASERAEITARQTLTMTATGTAKLTTKPSGDASAAGGQEPAGGAQAPPGDIQLDSNGALELSGDANASLSAGTTTAISAKAGVTVSGGEQVTIEADGTIAVSGATISIAATETLSISAPEILLG
jgi:phage protein D